LLILQINNRVKLLVCICYHHYEDSKTLPLLFLNLQTIKEYKCDYKIVVHTNSNIAKELIYNSYPQVETIVVTKLEHPYHLTWKHREYIKEHLDDFDVYMYTEDDVIIKYSQLVNYLETLREVWPNYVPSFVRYEINDQDGEIYALHPQRVSQSNIVTINGKRYYNIQKTYCACWILPADLLKQQMHLINNKFTFDQMIGHEGCRENAASFVHWQLGKENLIELESNELQISHNCLIHHASNKYTNLAVPEGEQGQHKLKDILIAI